MLRIRDKINPTRWNFKLNSVFVSRFTLTALHLYCLCFSFSCPTEFSLTVYCRIVPATHTLAHTHTERERVVYKFIVVWHLLSLVFRVFISIAFTVRSSMIIMIIIGIQMARCTRVASRESLPRAVAETVTQRPRPRPRPRPRRSKTVAETETESRDEATSTSASHTQMANKLHSRVYFMLPAEAESAEQTEAV